MKTAILKATAGVLCAWPQSTIRGPLVMHDGEARPDDLELAVRIPARYYKRRDAAKATMEETEKNGASRNYQVTPLPSEQIPSEWNLLVARPLMLDICSVRCP